MFLQTRRGSTPSAPNIRISNRSPQFGSIQHYSNDGHSTYHGMTLRVEKRYWKGLTMSSFLLDWLEDHGRMGLRVRR